MRDRYSAERLWAFRLRFSNAEINRTPPEPAGGGSLISPLKRFRAKWIPVRVKKTRQNKNLELWF
jgi:hypothetical protein